MKLLILYSHSIANYYVISNLSRKFDNLITIEENQNYNHVLKRTFRRKRHSLLSKINRSLFYIYFFLFLRRKVEKLFIKNLNFSERFKSDCKVKNINDTAAIQIAKEFSPDLILVFGTSLLKKKWFELNIPIVNSHLGIIPRYRGWLCWFWAVLEKNFNSIGISIHYVSKIPDGGEIIIQDYLDIFKLERIDLPHILFSETLLVDKNIAKAINTVLNNKENVSLDFNKYNYDKKYPHYFEPGLTDYLRFLSLTKKLKKIQN